MLQVLVSSSHLEVWILFPDLFLVSLTVHSLVLPLESFAGQRLPRVFLPAELSGPHRLLLLPGGLLGDGALVVAPLPASQGPSSLHDLHVSGLGAVAGRLTGCVVPRQRRESPCEVARGGVGGLPHQDPVVRAPLPRTAGLSGWRRSSLLASLGLSPPDVA